jgi:hypothetical protein
VKLKEIEEEAISLPERDRKNLVGKLLDTLPSPRGDVSDEEVVERDRALESGELESLSHREFVRRVKKERQR